jgi:hypothetical protein
MDQVEVGYAPYMVSADRLAEVGADFDAEAVDNAILAQLNKLVPAGVVVHRNGKVFADEPVADEARGIDWPALIGSIDLDQALADNPL